MPCALQYAGERQTGELAAGIGIEDGLREKLKAGLVKSNTAAEAGLDGKSAS